MEDFWNLFFTGIFIALLLLVLSKFLRKVPMLLILVIADTLNGKFAKNKWHKHAVIALPGAALLSLIIHVIPGEPIKILNFALTLFIGTGLCWLWEWNQRRKGAHQGDAGRRGRKPSASLC